MSGPRYTNFGQAGDEGDDEGDDKGVIGSAAGAVKGVAGAIGDLSIEDIMKTGVALSVLVIVGTLAINAAPFAAKGTARTIKHVPSVFGEILRTPFRLGGWLKQVRKDANPE